MQAVNELKSIFNSYINITNKFNKDDSFSKLLDESSAKLDELENKMNELKSIAKNDEEMFKVFDFMQIMTQLMYGNVDEKERDKLLSKAAKISNSL
ncbi:hypothetical protein Q4Y15_001569 [Campylobacter fetus]|uniref:Uncharacterized protein n=4 Tax=Campylobacter fetus TaxID=196 RepID=A0AAE6MBA1_CAMFE|nr:hypothetical protein [Campylobacter fetus]OCS22016.1 hypothetical protein CFVI97532_06880 [Campylobacter fetus subsp. venerealis cfvi97/532]OCS26556.1 hypothetical protein CFVB10_03045 [Campylobacter fetus subsp. venerealis cfvB10]OCS29171.1 hypothetical protein CFVCCUG33900_07935 [Campylobacter fetus subsp. venerealis LMG 6570 = CCUG 33900]OCS42533.1 hypothetical protein CFVI02298_04690 [Campylobacter fetus subsp. venerealis cfvi02/298]ABK82809.1 conserved hypothetical protein [Campylobact